MSARAEDCFDIITDHVLLHSVSSARSLVCPLLLAAGEEFFILPPHRRSHYETRGGNYLLPCSCFLVSSLKSSLNTAPKCSILRSNNKKIIGRGSSPLPRLPSQRGGGVPLPAPHHSRRLEVEEPKAALGSSTERKLKSGYAPAPGTTPQLRATRPLGHKNGFLGPGYATGYLQLLW